MKALSLTQPWAQLMADGRKHIETRSWPPFESAYGQLIAIHASKGWKRADVQQASAWQYDADRLPRGAIIAIVRLRDAMPTDRVRPGLEAAFGDYAPGRWAWITELVKKLDAPIPCWGHLGLWGIPPHLAAQIEKEIK